MKRNRFCMLVVPFSIGLWAGPVVAQTFTTLNDPVAPYGVDPEGISGNNIVGLYRDTSNTYHGFFYNGSTYTPLNDPNAATGARQGTFADAISGSIVAGFYDDSTQTPHGFLWNGSNYTALDDPAGTATEPEGISGNDIVGAYFLNSRQHGFLYDGSTWTTLDDPLAVVTYPGAISGNDIVGYYTDSSGIHHGFIYDDDALTWTTLDAPLGANGTWISGISGSNIIGQYEDSSKIFHPYLYNDVTSAWTALDISPPNGLAISIIYAIDGNNVVGLYDNTVLGTTNGFVATIPTPEPSAIVLLSVGAVALIGYRWQRRAMARPKRASFICS